jgi:hypothetical protein
MALLQSTMQGVGLVVALICSLSLAGSSTAQAGRSNASETDYVNGLPCNDLRKAYMAWLWQGLFRRSPKCELSLTSRDQIGWYIVCQGHAGRRARTHSRNYPAERCSAPIHGNCARAGRTIGASPTDHGAVFSSRWNRDRKIR